MPWCRGVVPWWCAVVSWWCGDTPWWGVFLGCVGGCWWCFGWLWGGLGWFSTRRGRCVFPRVLGVLAGGGVALWAVGVYVIHLAAGRRGVPSLVEGVSGWAVRWWFENSRACLYCLIASLLIASPMPAPSGVHESGVRGVGVFCANPFSLLRGSVNVGAFLAFRNVFCGGFDSGSG